MTRVDSMNRVLGKVAVVPAVLLMIMSAGAGGPVQTRAATNPALHLLKQSLRVSADKKAAHVVGGLGARISDHLEGFTFSVTVRAGVRGDVVDRRQGLRAHLKGQERLGGSARSYKLVVANGKIASKYRKTAWACTSLTSAGSTLGLGMGTITQMAGFERKLRRVLQVTDLGSTTFRGVPVWHLRATILTRIPMRTTGSSGKVKVTHPWVHVRANFWISRSNQTVRRVTAFAKIRAKQSAATLHLWARFSRYGEHVPIHLPPACRK